MNKKEEKRKGYISKLLTTTLVTGSALVVAAGGVSSALGASRATAANATVTGGVNMGGAFNPGDSIAFGGNHTLATGGAVTIGAIDTNGQAAVGAFTVADATSLGSVFNSNAANPAIMMPVTVNDAVTLTLTGTPGLKADGSAGTAYSYTNLGAITLGSANAGDATLAFVLNGAGAGAGNVKSATITSAIDGNNPGSGIITVAAYNDITFSGKLGNGVALNALTLAANSTATLKGTVNNFSGAVAAGGITFAANSVLNVDNGANITMVNGGNASDIDGAGGVNGTINFLGNSTVNAQDGIGRANGVTAINIGAGTVELSGNTAVVKAANINLTDANSVLKLSSAVTITGNITSNGVANQGKILINGADQVINGNIGTNAATGSIAAVQFATDHKLTVIATDASIYAGSIASTGGGTKGKLEIQGDTANLFNIGTDTNKLTSVTLMENKATGGAGNFTLKTGSSIYATSVDLAGAAQNNTLNLEDGTTINGAVITSNANSGTLVVKGNTHITGDIGVTAANKIAAINFDPTAVGKTLTIDGANVAANGAAFNFGAVDATVALTNKANITVTSPIGANAITANNLGTVTANNLGAGQSLTITGKIGDVAGNNALKMLQTTGNIVLTADSNIATIDIGNSDGSLTLNAGNYKIGQFAHADGSGTVIVNGAVTLKAGSVLTTTGTTNKLKGIDLKAQPLTVEDGVNISTVATKQASSGIFSSAGAGNGILNFAGTHTVDGAFTTKIAAIHAQGAAGKILTFTGDVNSDLIDVVADGTIQFAGNVEGVNLQATVAGKGTIEFINQAPVKVAPVVGANQLKVIKISGSDVEFAQGADTDELVFTNAGTASTVSLVAGDLDNTKVTTASTTRNHNITVEEDQYITKAIGTAANALGNLILNADKTIEVDTVEFFAGITTNAKNQGTVIFSKDGGVVYGLGDANNSLATVNIDANIVNKGDTYANIVTIDAGKTATFEGGVNTSTTKTQGLLVSGNAVFADGAALIGNVVASDKAANLTFNGGAQVLTELGTTTDRFANIKFVGNNKPVIVAKDIHGAKIDAANVSFDFSTASVNVDGAFTGANSSFDLGTQTTTFAGDTTLTGSSTISTTYSGEGKIGSIKTAQNVTIDGSGVTAMTININDSNGDLGTDSVVLIEASKALKLANVTPTVAIQNLSNVFVNWTASPVGNTIVLNRASDVKGGLQKIKNANTTGFGGIADAISQANIDILAKNPDAGIITDIGQVGAQDPKLAAELIARVTNNVDSTATQDATQSVTNVVASRMIGSGASNHSASQAQFSQVGVGVAAGDELDDAKRYGAWGMPFYNQATQKTRKGISGYKAKTSGGVVGFDAQANDRLIVGAALSYVKSDIKHKNIKAGDKTKLDMMMFSIYGSQQILDNGFVQGVASFGSGKVKNSEGRIEANNGKAVRKIASAKYDTMQYGIEVLGGYNYKAAENVTLTPMVGLAYNKFNDSGYTESGTNNQNRSVAKKSTDKFEGIIGARVAALNTDMNGVLVTPELHGFIRHAFNNKSPKMDVRLDGIATPLVTKSNKAAATTYVLGASVSAKAGNMEYGIGYDAQLANKYVGHQGTLKIRVNF